MKKQANQNKRVLGRTVAKQLSHEDLRAISGGRVTYSGCNCEPDACDIENQDVP